MRYAELRPDQLQAAIAEKPLAIWPIGALEWHGPHLPLGLDGFTAEAFAEKLQHRCGGVLLPCLWHPVTTLPHPYSLQVPTNTFRELVAATADGLASAGFQALAIVTGHYAQGHSLELFSLAEELEASIRIVAAAPLEPLEEDALLDHAAKWETAQLQLIGPDLIDLSTLPEDVSSRNHAVLGEHPSKADPQDAARKLDEALSVWQSWISRALEGDITPVQEFYRRRRAAYRPYADRYYRESWQQAIADWWAEKD